MILAGVFSSAHGVRGCVKARHYLNSPDVLRGKSIYVEEAPITVLNLFAKGERYLVLSLEGVTTRQSAIDLVKKKFSVKESILQAPLPEEYYHKDLIGITVYSGHKALGVVTAVHNFGASDVLEIIKKDRKTFMIPFIKEFILSVDLAKKEIHAVITQ